MEKDVWNRVTAGREGAASMEFKSLQGRVQEQLAAYRRLAQSLQGSGKVLAEGLVQRENQSLAALRGLAVLSGQKAMAGPLPPPQGTARALLQRCWKGNLELLAEYTARSAQPGTGVVFRGLAQNQEAQALVIAQLLGGLNG